MSKSIIQTGESVCFFCGRPTNLEKHHAIHGRGLRKLADEDGLWVWLCVPHHHNLHDMPSHPHDDELKALAQKAWIKATMKQMGVPEMIARELFRKRYGRFYGD